MKFIYVYDEETKNKLIKDNYSFLSEKIINGKKTFLFANDSNKINFSKDKVKYSNKLYL